MDGMAAVMVGGLLILGTVCYAISYLKVRAGVMIVYSDWMDFILSSLWLTLGGCGALFGCIVSQMEKSHEKLYISVGCVFVVLALLSLGWLITTAIKANNDHVLNAFLAIGAKLFVSVLIIVVIERFKEQFEKRRGLDSGMMIIPFAIAGAAFSLLVKPLIKNC